MRRLDVVLTAFIDTACTGKIDRGAVTAIKQIAGDLRMLERHRMGMRKADKRLIDRDDHKRAVMSRTAPGGSLERRPQARPGGLWTSAVRRRTILPHTRRLQRESRRVTVRAGNGNLLGSGNTESPAGTVVAQLRLVAKEAERVADEARESLRPALAQRRQFVAHAFRNAVALSKMTRASSSPRPSDFIASYLRLREYLSRNGSLPANEGWPRTPETTFSWRAGDSAAEVATDFADMVGQAVAMARYASRIRNETDDDYLCIGVVEPDVDPRIVSWRDAAINELRDHTLHLLPAWPMWEIHRDEARLLSQLDDEFRRAVEAGESPRGGRPGTTRAGRPLTAGEQRLWDALAGRLLTGRELASENELNSSEETVRRWVAQLRRQGYKIKNRRGRGYFRPDAPPADLSEPPSVAQT